MPRAYEDYASRKHIPGNKGYSVYLKLPGESKGFKFDDYESLAEARQDIKGLGYGFEFPLYAYIRHSISWAPTDEEAWFLRGPWDAERVFSRGSKIGSWREDFPTKRYITKKGKVIQKKRK